MSYCRWPVYIWGDGYATHFWARDSDEARAAGARPIEEWCLDEDWSGGLSLEDKLLDQFVVARFAEIVERGSLPRTLRRLRSKKSPIHGNFGSHSVLEALGLDPVGEFSALTRGVSLGKKHAWTVRCPVCKAKKGERCTTSGGNLRRTPHQERIDKREQLQESEFQRIRERQEAAS